MRDRELWLWVGAGFVALAVALVGSALAFDATSKVAYSLWTSVPMIIAYIAVGVAAVSFGCAVRGLSFPGSASRREHEISSALLSRGIETAVPTSSALELQLEDERWDIWQASALLAELKIRITARRPIRITHFDLESDDPGLAAGRPRLNQAQVDALFNDMIRGRDGYGSSQLRSADMLPGDSISGWWVQWAYLPFPERAGHPRCVFKVWDSQGDVYELEIPPRGPQIHRASG